MQKSYNGLNISSNSGTNINSGQQEGTNGNTGSGSSTPNNLSQQNLIKIMKKIKSSAAASSQNNKENAVLSAGTPNVVVNLN